MTLADTLANREYLRQRLEPRPGDPDYICLIDLLAAIRRFAPKDPRKILDYGCGGSPYRALFPGAAYHRADLAGAEDLDFEFGPDSLLPREIGGYDLVLSSQVLEHVLEPDAYLAECLRVLDPGGCLLVTTHGVFWDHACPHDYWRWTAHGLRRALTKAGFEVKLLLKTTTNERAVLYLLEKELGKSLPSAGALGKLYAASSYLFRRMSPRLRHLMADKCFPDRSIVDATHEQSESLHPLYIIVGAVAVKPAGRPPLSDSPS